MEQEYEIWCEGYSATCEHQPHHYYGKSKGTSFLDACLNFRYPESTFNGYGEAVIKKGEPIRLIGGRVCCWACCFYETEDQASHKNKTNYRITQIGNQVYVKEN